MQRALLVLSMLVVACASDDRGDDEASTESTGDSTGEGESTDSTTSDGDTTTGDGDGDGESTEETTADTSSESMDDTTGDGDGETTGETGDVCGHEVTDCASLIAAFVAESETIRSCEAAPECGQVLQGTSCGCTRNWVARIDADTQCFYELIDLAEPLQCELGLGSTCDCPEADGFDCIGGICTWNYL